MKQKCKAEFTSSGLHLLAMLLMLCDHSWAMLFPAQEWMTCVGRIAFPIFAFLAAEGYVHTGNLRRYLGRMLLGALLAEIPFDLMYGGTVFYPFHQNVLWTFLIALLLISLIEKCRSRFKTPTAALLTVGIVVLGYFLGAVTMVDYYGVGVVTVLMFYLFRGQNWRCRVLQLLCLYLLNVKLLGGFYYPVMIGNYEFRIVQQGFALFALIPIWLYRGRRGFHTKWFQYSCYGFYPVHMLILYFLREWMLR